MNSCVVIKVSGHEIDAPEFLSSFADVIRALPQQVIIVHGGGREISQLQEQMGIVPRYVDGLRVTDAASLAVVEMVLCGTINTRLVRILNQAGVDALGMSGVDRGLVRARPYFHAGEEMGFTGEVTTVRGEVLRDFLAQGITPVLAPVCLGEGSAFNVNADHVAGAVGAAVNAARIIFVSNVRGVLVNDQPVDVMTPEHAEALIADGTIFGGMIPKVRTALHALTQGVAEAVITDLHGLRTGGGTVFRA
jgi:acetylglutamate kinase